MGEKQSICILQVLLISSGMDKRSTQLSIPLKLEGRKMRDVVKQHWNITFSRQGKISVYGKRIMGLVLAQIQDNDNQLKPYYQMRVSEVMDAGEVGGNSVYEKIKKSLDELAAQIWRIEDIENEIYRPKQLINTSTLESKDGFEYGYSKGVITIVLNPALGPYFLQMSHYSKYELKNYMQFKSWYSMRLWEILSAFRDQHEWPVGLDEYRKLMDCEKKYPHTKDLIQKTTAEPLEELKGTPLEFMVEKTYPKYSGKGRKPVIGLKFVFVKPPSTTEGKLLRMAKTSDEHKKIIEDLRDTWKITQECLVKYLPIIKLEGAKKLRRQFELMESQGSKRKIDNREKYCNSAIKRAAEAVND